MQSHEFRVQRTLPINEQLLQEALFDQWCELELMEKTLDPKTKETVYVPSDSYWKIINKVK